MFIERGYKDKILDVLRTEGGTIKRSLIMENEKRGEPFSHIIMDPTYFITNLDLWILLSQYKIPSIIISTFPLLETDNKKNAMVASLGTRDNDNFVFILSPAQTNKSYSNKYSIIHAPSDYPGNITIHIPVSILIDSDSIKEAIDSYIRVEEFLKGGKDVIADIAKEVVGTRKKRATQPTGFKDISKTRKGKRLYKKLKIVGAPVIESAMNNTAIDNATIDAVTNSV
jgi:hypothetical protein